MQSLPDASPCCVNSSISRAQKKNATAPADAWHVSFTAHQMLCSSFTVDSPNVSVADGVITSNYTYQTTRVAVAADGSARVTPVEQRYVFKTQTKVPKLGMMLVGWGGNNGSTVTAGILANVHKMSWPTREGTRYKPRFPPLS